MRVWFAQQVFSKAEIWFSIDGETYEDDFLPYSYIPDVVLENARNVSIGLHGREGKLIKLHLYFAARWIIIGEVSFDASEFLISHFLPVEKIFFFFCIQSTMSFYEKNILSRSFRFPTGYFGHLAYCFELNTDLNLNDRKKVARMNERILKCDSQIVMFQEIL